MKLCTLLVFVFSHFAIAEHPRDLVSSDAIVVLSIQEGETVNKIIQSILHQAEYGPEEYNIVSTYLADFIEDPTAIDLSYEILILVEPTEQTPDLKQNPMYGYMPHLVLICKPKADRELKILTYSGLKTSRMHDGWFVASGSSNWSPPETNESSPLLAKLPKGQVSSIVDYNALWRQFGGVVQMTGGVTIGSLNKPGPSGVISPQTKKRTAETSSAFTNFMKWCSEVDSVGVSINIIDYNLNVKLNVAMKNPKVIPIDNSSILTLASLITDDTVQFAVAGNLTRKLLNFDVAFFQDFGYFLRGIFHGPHMIMMQAMRPLANLTGDNVIAYSLSNQYGLTASFLAEVSEQDTYLAKLPETMDGITVPLLQELNMELAPTIDTSNTWNVRLNGSDDISQGTVDAIFPKDVKWRFGKQGSSRIASALGPQSWKPFSQSHSTPLSQVINENKHMSIDFALSVDARSYLRFIGTGRYFLSRFDAENKISASPPARWSFVIGRDDSGSVVDMQADLLGLAKLLAEMQDDH